MKNWFEDNVEWLCNPLWYILASMAAIIALCILSGCVTTHAVLPDGTELDYTRVGNQQIGSFGWDSESKVFYFDRQKSDNETLYQAMNKLVEKIP